MSTILYTALAFFLLIASPLRAFAQEDVVRKLLLDRDREIKAMLGDKAELTEAESDDLKQLINGQIDFERMARTALGPQWDPLTPEQRTEFVNVFSEIVKGQSLADLSIYRLKMTVGKISIDSDSAHVETSTLYKDCLLYTSDAADE